MKIVVAPDSFKGSLKSNEASAAIVRGIQKVFQTAETIEVPMADGGEGTVTAIVKATNGQIKQMRVQGPDGEMVSAHYGLLPDQQTVVIESAETSGMQYVNASTSNPFQLNTFGLGQMIRACLDQGYRRMIIGLGGVATNDGGIGLATALGARFYNARHETIQPLPHYMRDIAYVDLSALDQRLNEVDLKIAADVTNPFLGTEGATFVFGRQKGLITDNQMVRMTIGLEHYAEKLTVATGTDYSLEVGSGAAGGLGFVLLNLFNRHELISGGQLVIEMSHFNEIVSDADILFVGEGSLDNQTQFGKSPVRTACAAKKVNPQIVVIGLAGHIGDVTALYTQGIDTVFSITSGVLTQEYAMQQADRLLTATAENVSRLINIVVERDQK
ncbi:glycerate kinase [Weissella diestrammenae]|uniref:Glycerate kinase n=1 Tax=Weissella diestrammenae TaxID=1162633 RepID=A0A7G9T6E8_9LACO|nr:glycerate kinase [Weissella diestrammenae]MCM0583280.1 glycerate kinase [Weissella diestrammenae]QNN75673.1 glycerate kinase [Weissella diestrammenae]